MKIIGTFGVVVIASIALLQPAEGRQRGGGGGGGRSFSSGHSFSGSARHFSSGPRNFSGGNSRSYRSAPRYSSQPSYRHRAYSSSNSSRRFNSPAALRNRSSNQRLVANRTADFNRSSNPRFAANRSADISRRPRSDSDARFAPSRRAGVRSQGFNNNGGRVVGNHTRNWNRNRDHNWNGNRCRWRNNHWVIIGPWYPWGSGGDTVITLTRRTPIMTTAITMMVTTRTNMRNPNTAMWTSTSAKSSRPWPGRDITMERSMAASVRRLETLCGGTNGTVA